MASTEDTIEGIGPISKSGLGFNRYAGTSSNRNSVGLSDLGQVTFRFRVGNDYIGLWPVEDQPMVPAGPMTTPN